VTGVYASPSDGALLFALVVPVRDPRGQVIGIIGSAQRLDIVRRWLASATVPGGDLYLVDRQGQLIFHPTRTGPEHLADFARVPVVERLLRGERGLAEIENPVERETRLTAYRPLSWLGWGLVVYRDPVRVLDATRLATRALEGAGSILTLAIAGLGVVALRNRRRALRALSELQAKTVALGAAQEELVRKERLALLGQLAGSVSHELRNPLGVMKNVVYYLNMTLPNEGRVRKHLQILDREVATANRIVSGLLDYARVRPSQPAPTDLNSLVTESLQRASVPQSVTVVANLARDLAPVAVDREQIGLVLGNLIGNAVQAMPEGGTLTVETAADGDGTRVSVADTGVGIAPEHVAKIFEPLFTTKPRGIGLGLSVVKSLAEANGGRVSVESAPGQGSRFVLHMGLAKADASARSRREG
jgi:signal transduction histidine kinase